MKSEHIERAVLSTALFSEVFDIPHAKTELKEEWFTTPFRKAVARQINHDRAIGLMDDTIVADNLSKGGNLDQSEYLAIIAANPLGSEKMYFSALGQLKKNVYKAVAI